MKFPVKLQNRYIGLKTQHSRKKLEWAQIQQERMYCFKNHTGKITQF